MTNPDLTPRKPVRRTLLWPDAVLDVRDVLLELLYTILEELD